LRNKLSEDEKAKADLDVAKSALASAESSLAKTESSLTKANLELTSLKTKPVVYLLEDGVKFNHLILSPRAQVEEHVWIFKKK